ncbi:beta-galactosidase [Occultella gossypii]|uniref:Beta-galactosidase n=1 Tax=Occultella gossypii TaxID=2800820 RepID=A0ABS7S8V4_9MICO|nr:beta-galactosidase [Occultella gossypii]MBZ2196774.1 beta-galactosidase [Occultella gossypii]
MRAQSTTPAGFHIGASYYPEHWPEARWKRDLGAMAGLGFTTVRMLEFAWSRLEPSPQEYRFDWVDRAADMCAAFGLAMMLGTPTAAPPVWLTSAYPDILPVGPDGLRRQPGGRRHYCLHNPRYREAARGVVERLADHLAPRTDIVAWQVDNEVGAYRSTFCYCDQCEAAFRVWLRSRYEDVETLNELWGNVFWSQEVRAWEEVQIPRPAMNGWTGSNKSALLDFWRFSSDALADFVGEQADALRVRFPQVPVTTNWTSLSSAAFDREVMAQRLDFTSWDNYELDLYGAAFNHDVVRGAKRAPQATWIAEQRCAPPDNRQHVPLLRDGEVTSMTLHNIACGSDATIYFRLEQALFGAENAHGGILDRSGGADTRIYRELAASVPRLRQIGDAVAGSQVRARVAIVHDADSSATVTGPFPHLVKKRSQLVRHLDHLVRPYHRALQRLGVDVDVIPPTRDLGAYDVVILAGQVIATPEVVAPLRDYVAAGGHLVATPFTAHVDSNANLLEATVPAGLADIFGLVVPEQDFLADGETIALTRGLRGMLCCDLLRLEGATARHEYLDTWYSETVAISSHTYGRGNASYVGTVLDDRSTRTLLAEILTEAGVQWLDLPQDVHVRRRFRRTSGPDQVQEYLFVVNAGDTEQTVTIEGSYRDLETGDMQDQPLRVRARDAVVLCRDGSG